MRTFLLLTFVSLSLGSNAAWACRPGPGRWGDGEGPMHQCGKMLLHAPPDVLQSKAGVDAGQVKRIEAIRGGFLKRKEDLRAQMARERTKGQTLWQADLPNEKQLLSHMRAMQTLHGKLMEARIKTIIQLMGVLKKDQRTKLRSACFGTDSAGKGNCPHCGKGDCKGNCPHCGKGDCKGNCPHCGKGDCKGNCPHCGKGDCPFCGKGQKK